MQETASSEKGLRKTLARLLFTSAGVQGLKKLKEIFLRQSQLRGSWVLGLDQGTASLRYAIWDRKAGKLIQFGQHELDRQDASGGKARADVPSLLKELSRSLPRNKVCAVHMNLQGGPLLLGFLELPTSGKNVQLSVLKHALRAHLPFPPEEAALIYQETGVSAGKETDASSKNIVSYAACHKPVTGNMVRMVQTIFGVVPDITSQGYAQESLVRLLELSPPDELTAVVSGGRSITSISIVRNGRLLFEREIPLAGQDITRSIFITHLQGQTLRSTDDLKTAEQLKRKSTIPGAHETDAENAKLYQAIQGVLAAWIQDIRLSFAYFNENYDPAPIQRVFLAGGMANHAGLADHMTRELNMRVEVLRWPEERIAAVSRAHHADVFQKSFHEYATALGLAVKPALQSSLTPREFQSADWAQIWQGLLRVFALVGSIILAGSFIFLQAKEIRLISLKQTVDTHRMFLKKLEGPYQEMLRWEQLLRRAEFHAPQAEDFLRMLTRMTPADLILQNLSFNRESGDMVLDGVIYGDPKKRAVVLANFSKVFKQDPRFKNITVPLWESSASGADKGRFKLTARYQVKP